MAVPGNAPMGTMNDGEEIISETTEEEVAPTATPNPGSSPMARARRNEPTLAPPRGKMPQQRNDAPPPMPARSARRTAQNNDPYYASY